MESIEGQEIDKHYTLKHWPNPAPLEMNDDRCWVKAGSENYKSIAVKGWHNSQYISDKIMKKIEAPWTAALPSVLVLRIQHRMSFKYNLMPLLRIQHQM